MTTQATKSQTVAATMTDTDIKNAVIVVGAGRSGTSVLTAGIGALGVNLGDQLKPGGIKKNPRGFFEDTELLNINHRVHESLGLHANGSNVRPVEPRAWITVDLSPLRDEATAIIERRVADGRIWGLKSGGLLRLLPFWQDVFVAANVAPRYVIALRNPLGVANSRANLDFYRGFQEKSDLEWLTQVVPYIDRLRGHPMAVVDYDRLMQSPTKELIRVGTQLDLPMNRSVLASIETFANEFATEDLYHHRHDPAELDDCEQLNVVARDAYLCLRRLATDEITCDDPALWDQLHAIQQEFEIMTPMLRYVDFLEKELKGRYWGLAGLWQKLTPRLRSASRETARQAT